MTKHRATCNQTHTALCHGVPKGHAAEYSLVDEGVTCLECLAIIEIQQRKLKPKPKRYTAYGIVGV